MFELSLQELDFRDQQPCLQPLCSPLRSPLCSPLR